MKILNFLNIQIAFMLFFVLFNSKTANAQNEVRKVKSFDQVIISPHVRVILTEGETESVYIENEGVAEDKVNIEVVGKTLRIYLDQARIYTRSYKSEVNGYKHNEPMYRGTLVTAYITYKNLKKLSVRGEETVSCESPLIADNFRLKIYGESHVVLSSIESDKMKISLFGENDLEIREGTINRQKINSFGENKVEAPGLNCNFTKINTFGESKFNINVQQNIKVSAFGESDIYYKGDAIVHKVIVIGENKIFQNSF